MIYTKKTGSENVLTDCANHHYAAPPCPRRHDIGAVSFSEPVVIICPLASQASPATLIQLSCSLSIVGRSGSRHCGTSHLDRAYDDILASSKLQTLEAELANLDALANLQGSNIDVEVLRNLLVRSSNVDLTDREVHATTITYTLCKTCELNWDTDCDRLLIVNLEEVYVKNSVSYRVELDILEDSCVRLAVDNEVDNIDVRSVDNLTELSHRNCKSHSCRLAVLLCEAVNVARNKSFLTQCLRSFLAKVCTLLTCYINLFHNVLL